MWRQPVGRLIDQFAREILRFGDDAPPLRGLLQLRTAARSRHGEIVHSLDVFLFALVAIRLEVAQDRAFHCRLHVVRRGERTIE